MSAWNRQDGWAALIALIIATGGMLLLFMATLLGNVILTIAIGIITGWLFSLTFIGNWITAGLNMLNFRVQPEELYKIGAAVGFIAGFFKGTFKIKK